MCHLLLHVYRSQRRCGVLLRLRTAVWWWRWQSHGTGSTSLWRKKLSTLTMTVLKMTHYVVKRYPALHTSIIIIVCLAKYLLYVIVKCLHKIIVLRHICTWHFNLDWSHPHYVQNSGWCDSIHIQQRIERHIFTEILGYVWIQISNYSMH